MYPAAKGFIGHEESLALAVGDGGGIGSLVEVGAMTGTYLGTSACYRIDMAETDETV